MPQPGEWLQAHIERQERQVSTMREARLRAEFAHLYPGLTPGVWQPAGRIAEAVLANLLLQNIADAPTDDRALPETHFEFRGGPGSSRAGLRGRAGDRQ